MAFLDQISRAMETAGNMAKQKTKDSVGAAGIHSLIAEEERTLLAVYQRIGREYAARHSEDAEEALRMMVEAAKDSEKKISEYKKQLQLTANTVVCPNCGQETAAGAKFCSNCGTPMPQAAPQQTACPRCGSPLEANVRFCANCGERIPQAGAAELQTGSHFAGGDTAPEQRVCANCGSVLTEGMEFCTHCGASVGAAAAQTEAEQVTAAQPETEQQDAPSVCANCGREIPAGMIFCMYCGTPVGGQDHRPQPHAKTCPVCGAALEEDSAFCDQCGAPIA